MPEIVTWSQARERGLKDYFSGIPCKRGHVSERTFSSGLCKQCASESNKLWMKEKSADRLAYRKEYTAENIERVRKWRNDWRKANIEKAREGERKATAKIIAKNPERYRNRAAQWQKNNPDKVRARFARRRARERAAEGKFTAEDVSSLLKSQDGKCAYCFTDMGKKYHVDHIVPLFRGGSNWPDNIQLCCPTCNISKGTKDHGEFMRYLGRSI